MMNTPAATRETPDALYKKNDRTHADIYVGSSPIHERGVYAAEAIPKGVRVIDCGGIFLHRDELGDTYRYMQVGAETYLAEDPKNPGIDDLINHSCAPNVGFATGELILYALRDIEKDEELFWDYSSTMNEPGWAIDPCRCGAPACRGKIASFCDLSKPDQKRLRGIVLGYLR